MATFYFNLLIYIYICIFKFFSVDIEMSGSSRIVVIKSNACARRFLFKKMYGKRGGVVDKKKFS